jgi:Family of unknown function (DUF6447)
MSKITINNKEYDLGLLSEKARANIVSIQFVDAEIQRLQSQIAVMQTARTYYSLELDGQLKESVTGGDAIKFN